MKTIRRITAFNKVMKQAISCIQIMVLLLFTGCTTKPNDVVDQDGNRYASNEHQGLTWMTENLRTTTDRGGKEISYHYPNDNEAYSISHGLLYDYKTACTVCPQGWRLPTKDEMTQAIFTMRGFIIPFAGYGNSGEHPNQFNKTGLLWTGSSDDEFAWAAVFEKDSTRLAEQHLVYGFSVRCVK